MKNLIVLALLMTTSVFAAEIKVYEDQVSYWHPNLDTSWKIYRSNGDAAVQITLSNNLGPREGNQQYKTFPVKVEGLVFDKDTSKIMLTHEGQLFECASVVKRWYGNRYFEKDCQIVERSMKVGRKRFHQVFIITK